MIFFIIVINTHKMHMHCRVHALHWKVLWIFKIEIEQHAIHITDTLQEYVWGRKLVTVYSYFIRTDKMIHLPPMLVSSWTVALSTLHH